MFLTFHSYGQYILYPWGFTSGSLPDNASELDRMGRIAANAMNRASGHVYSVGSAAQMLYPAAGTKGRERVYKRVMNYSIFIDTHYSINAGMHRAIEFLPERAEMI